MGREEEREEGEREEREKRREGRGGEGRGEREEGEREEERGKRGNELSNVDKKSVKHVMYIHQNPKYRLRDVFGSAEFCCDDTR